MQTKSSYRVLKWTFILGAMASLGACVVTADGGDDDDFDTGGDSGSSTVAGKNSTAGSGGSAAAGKSAGGSSGSATAGASAGGQAGEGGAAYVPGVCDDDLAVPSHPRDTTIIPDDDNFPCRKCLKMGCEDAWATCYGDTPTSACGYGSTPDSLGQFECIRSCFVKDTSADDAETVLGKCEQQCLDQCADKDQGFATSDTQELLGCGQDHCLAECFTPE